MSFWDLFKPKKKKKKENTQPQVRRRSFASKPQKTETKSTPKSVPTSSRKGRQANTDVVKKAQVKAKTIVSQNKTYTEGLKTQKKKDTQHEKKYGKNLYITVKGRGGKRFQEANQGKSTFVQNTKGNSGAYKSVTNYFKENKAEQEYQKDKVERDYKTKGFSMGFKDGVVESFFGDENAASKAEKRLGTKINVDLHDKNYESGKMTGVMSTYLLPGAAQGKIASGIMKGGTKLLKATSTASKVGKSAPKLGKSVKMSGKAKSLAKKASATHKVKAAEKGYTKGQHFKASMAADSMTSTPMNMANASVDTKQTIKENKEAKAKIKGNIKEANKQIAQVKASSMSAEDKKKAIKQLTANKKELQAQADSISTDYNKEYLKNFIAYEGMDRLIGGGVAGMTAKGMSKDVAKTSVAKSKLRKMNLGDNLNKAKAKARSDIAKAEAEEVAKATNKTPVKGKAVKSAEGKIKGRTLKEIENETKVKTVVKGKPIKNATGEAKGRTVVYKRKDTGEVVYEGSPQTTEQKKVVLQNAIKKADGVDNLDVKEVGSPQAQHRRPTLKAIEERPTPFDDIYKAQEKQAKELQGLNKQAKVSQTKMEKGLKQRKEPKVEEPKAERPKTSADFDNELKDLESRRDNMSYGKYNEQKSKLEAQRKEVKAKEDVEAQAKADKRQAKRIENGKTKSRTMEKVQEDLEAKETAPVASVRRELGHSKSETKFKPAAKVREKAVDAGAAIEDIARSMQKSSDPKIQQQGKDLYSAINAVRQSRSQAQFHIFADTKAREALSKTAKGDMAKGKNVVRGKSLKGGNSAQKFEAENGKMRDMSGLQSVVQEYLGTKNLGKSASEITTPLHDLEKKMKKQGLDIWGDFQDYVFHMHNPARMKQGKAVFSDNIDGVTSQNFIKDLEKKYKQAGQEEAWNAIKQAQRETVDYFKTLQDMSVKAGLISKDTRSFLDDMYEQYIPTFRDRQGGQKGVTSNPFDKSVGVSKEKEAKGSAEDLLSIEQQMIDKTQSVYQRIANNNMIKKLAEAQGGSGDDLIKQGITPEEMLDKSVFAEKVKGKDEYVMKYFDNGEMKAVPCSRDVHDAIKALNYAGANPANYGGLIGAGLKGVAGANSVFKKLVTEWNPFFAMWRNPMKDIGDAMMYSRDLKEFLVHMPQTAQHIAKRDKYWQLWKASGGTSSSFFEDTKYLRTSKNPIGALNQFFEQYPRMTEFAAQIDKQLKAAGHKPGEFQYLTKEMVDNASQAGADITVNFGRSGTWTRNLNKFGVPFLNPGVQGLSKAARTLVTERQGAKAWVGLAVKAAALGWTPAVVTELVYANDPDYQMLNARDKANNLCIKMKDGNFLKIPMGRLLADISAPSRKIASDVLGTNGYTWKDVFELVKNNSAPANPIEDNLFMPLVRTMRNQTWYGGKIESDWEEENKLPEDIYDANTSELTKKLSAFKIGKNADGSDKTIGQALNMSPKKMDALIKSYSGVVGETLLPLTTQKAKGGGALSSFKLLAKKTYEIDPTYSNKLLSEFYDKYAEVKKGADKTEARKKLKQEYQDQAERLGKISDAIKDVQGMNIDYDKKNKMIENLQDFRNKEMLKFNKSGKMPTNAQYIDMAAANKYVGENYAIEHYVNEKDQKDTKAYAKNHDLSDIINVNKELSKLGFPTTRNRQPRIKALAIEDTGKGNKALYNYYNVDKGTRKLIKEYKNSGGSLEELGAVQKSMSKTAKSVGRSVGDLPKGAVGYALAKASGKNRVFQMYDESKPNSKEYWKHSTESGKGMVATGLTLKDRQKAYDACKNASGHCASADIVKYLDKQKNWTKEQKSYMFWQLANWNTKENPYGNYTPKFKPKKSADAGKVDWNKNKTLEQYTKAAKENADDAFWTRYRFAKQAKENAKTRKNVLYAPYKNDKDYIPKETLQVKATYDKEGIDEIKNILNGYPKRMIERIENASKNSPKIKGDSDTIFKDDTEGSSGGGGRRGYRRRGRGRKGRGGGSGGGGGVPTKTTEAKIPTARSGGVSTKRVDWTPKKVSTKAGWTNAQIRKVFNSLISSGMSEKQAIARINSLWNTRFSK